MNSPDSIQQFINHHKHGIENNLSQFVHQLIQVLMVGLTLGMMRTVIPALAESEFGIPKGSYILLMAFVVAFGFVKSSLNFVAGRLSERMGRKIVLLLGWFIALPIPFIINYAPSWNWIVFATILLGMNQGFTWSMTQTSKLDISRTDQRGVTIGLNEFSGYVGVAIAGIVTAYCAALYGARHGLMLFGTIVIVLAIIHTLYCIKDTLPWAKAEVSRLIDNPQEGHIARYPTNISNNPTTVEIFKLMSWGDKRMASFCQAGLIEKFVDTLIWGFYPVHLYQRGLTLSQIGWVVGIYAFVWGGSQLFTGKLSDYIGRKIPIVWGMWICGIGVAMMIPLEGIVWWSVSAALTGLGMALLYPNLSAAISDIAHPHWRGTAIGIYRFWRDLGYGIGALTLGMTAYITGGIIPGFTLVAFLMFTSGVIVMVWGDETHPRLNPGNPRRRKNETWK